jgi:YYY domain-containing protein
MHPWVPVLLWYLLLSLLGLCVLPYARMVFRQTPGAALVLSRSLALLLVPYLCWLLGHAFAWPFTRAGAAGVAALLACAWVALFARRWRWTRAELRRDWAVFWRCEIALIAALAAGAWVKMHLSSIAGEGEKFMDLSLFAHLARLESFPPADPWMAGPEFTINYYYGGHLVFATLAKLSALPIGVAYNLAIASLFAFTVLHAFFLGRSLGGHSLYGVLAALLLAVAGNLDPAWRFWKEGAWLPNQLLLSTRVIVDGADAISEYPSFSFYWSDLHGHVNALPFGLLFLALLWEIVRRPGTGWRAPAFRVGSIAFGLGALGFINGMDAPGYAPVAGAMLLLCALSDRAGGVWWKRWGAALASAAAQMAAAGALAALLFAPFVFAYHSPLRPGFPLGWTMWRTDPGELLRFWGVQLAALVPFACLCAVAAVRARRSAATVILGAATTASITGAVLGLGFTGVLLLALLASVAAEQTREDLAASERYVLVLGLLAAGALLACELIYIRDYYGPPIQRRMTIFKVYFHAWAWLALVVPYALRRVALSRAPLAARCAALAPFALLAVLALAAPYEVVRRARSSSFPPVGLDGQTYLTAFQPVEYRALRWLQREVAGTPVIVEAHGDPYGYFFRVSANTGLPTILGSVEHQSTVYGRSALVDEMDRRIADIRAIYETEDATTARKLLEWYAAEYVFVGVLERRKYRVAAGKFESPPFTKVYDDGVQIYRLDRSGGSG